MTQLQQALVKAIFATGEESRALVSQLPEGLDTDEGTASLLPLLQYQLERQGIAHPLAARGLSLRRRAWMENQLRRHHLARTLEAFTCQGLDAILLKGIAMALQVYPEAGLRPMRDVDIYVPVAHVRRAVEWLLGHGWTTDNPRIIDVQESFLRYRHSACFFHAEQGQLDLHWHVMYPCCTEEADEVFRSSSRPLEVGGVVARVLHPSDQFVHACVHGYLQDQISSIQWVLDALMILRHAEVDWNRVAELTNRLSLAPPMRQQTALLRQEFGAAVPNWFMEELQTRARDYGEESLFHYLHDEENVMTVRSRVAGFLHHWRRGGGDWRDLPRFAQYHWNLPSLAHLGPRLVRWAAWRFQRLAQT